MLWSDSQAGSVVVDYCRSGGNCCNRFICGKRFFDELSDVVALFEADDCVDSVGFGEQFFALSLRQAAGDDNLFDFAFSFLVEGVIYRIQGLGFGRFDEAAGVYNEDIGVVGIGGYNKSGQGDLCEHSLGIDDIFWTAERDKTDGYSFFVFFPFHYPPRVSENGVLV